MATVDRFADFGEALPVGQRLQVRPPGRCLHPRHRPRPRGRQTLEFGGVLINEVPTFRADQMPYGGVKDSGNTREGPAFAVHELTEERFVTLQGSIALSA